MNSTQLISVRLLLAAVLSLLSFGTLAAQVTATGSIEGRVLNATSGNYLHNVRIAVKDTLIEATTNQNGEYRISGLPAGTVTLGAAFTGLTSQTRKVSVAAGQTVRADFELVLSGAPSDPGVVQLAAFTVEERELTAAGAALHEQRAAPNIKNVVAMEEFGDLGISNPGHFLTYVPGVSNVYNTTGEVEGIGMRGMASSGTVVTFDGAPAASNDPASRSYNFSGTSVANLERIEVTKVPTPDLPANAVGGTINMITKSGFNRRTAQLRYNLLATIQAKGSHGNFPSVGEKLAGTDVKTTKLGIQPGFDLSYSRPIGENFAFTLNAGRNARYQDREYHIPTWDRVRAVQTAATLNSVINIFYQDVLAAGADWKAGRSVFRFRADHARYNAITRQNQFGYNYGAGAVGNATSTTGAATGVGTLTQTAGANPNQYRRLVNGRLSQDYAGDLWKFDWSAGYSEAKRDFRDIDEGMFYTAAATLSNVVVSAQGLDGINRGALPKLSVQTRTGAAVDPFDVTRFTLNTAGTGQMNFKNSLKTGNANVSRSFATTLPLTLKAGVAIEKAERDNVVESKTWNFRPPAAAGGQLVGNFDLIADAYSARRKFDDDIKIKFISTTKLYNLYREHPEYFQLVENTAYINRVNNSKLLEETISAGYLRADLKALDNRLWVVAGARFERTDDKGYGPLNDIRNTYVRNAAGAVVLTNGRPTPITTDALALAKLQYKERGAVSEKSYSGYYPSLNASYSLGEKFVLRGAFARTIGRPDLSFIIPGTSISDPSAAAPTITVNNTGLEPWTSNNYDLTLESYEWQGATLALSGFRKEVSKFFTSVRIPATAALLEQYGLPNDILTSNYEIITRENSVNDANINGVEWSWRQSLRPFNGLPGWARSVGFFVNGTHLRISGPGVDDFTGYSTRIINYGAAFARGNFAVKVNATYSNGPRAATVAANATTPAGTYTSVAPRTLVSGSIEYRIKKSITLHLSGQNLTNVYWRNMTYSPGAPEYTRINQLRDTGIAYVIGVKGEF